VSRPFVPHDYQAEAMDWLQRHEVGERCGLFMPMGGGKTVSTLTALDQLSLIEAVYPVLVLAPKRVARSTWPEEVEKWDHLAHLSVVTITGNERERRAALAREADIYTTNYEQLPWLVEALGDDWPFLTVIADESTRLKSYRLRQGSKRAAALAKVAFNPVQRFINLTGTPNPNGLQDLWGQTYFLDRGQRLGRSYSAFETRWFTKGYDGFSIEPTDYAQKQIEDRLRDIYLTVTGLPVDEPIRNKIMVDLPPAARSIYRDMEKDMFAELDAVSEIEAVNAAARTMKCLQLANGAAYIGEDAKEWKVVHDEKLDALESVIEEAAGAPVLVAYHFQSDLARLRKRFSYGRHLDAEPQTLRDWNAGKIRLLFAHPKSAGHGLNMADGGNILAFFSLNWNLEEHMQIIERLGPMRQKQAGYDRPVFLHYILARGTVDELVLQRLETKKTTQEILIEAMKRRKM